MYTRERIYLTSRPILFRPRSRQNQKTYSQDEKDDSQSSTNDQKLVSGMIIDQTANRGFIVQDLGHYAMVESGEESGGEEETQDTLIFELVKEPENVERRRTNPMVSNVWFSWEESGCRSWCFI